MSSRSATVLVIFSVAVIAFCLASVFAAMTGPISILPNETDSGSLLDNLSTDTDSDNYNSYGYDDSNYYSGYDDSQSDDSHVETTTDHSNKDNSKTDGSNVETTTDSSDSSDVEPKPDKTN